MGPGGVRDPEMGGGHQNGGGGGFKMGTEGLRGEPKIGLWDPNVGIGWGSQKWGGEMKRPPMGGGSPKLGLRGPEMEKGAQNGGGGRSKGGGRGPPMGGGQWGRSCNRGRRGAPKWGRGSSKGGGGGSPPKGGVLCGGGGWAEGESSKAGGGGEERPGAHRDAVRVFLADLLPFAAPFLERMLLLIEELHGRARPGRTGTLRTGSGAELRARPRTSGFYVKCAAPRERRRERRGTLLA